MEGGPLPSGRLPGARPPGIPHSEPVMPSSPKAKPPAGYRVFDPLRQAALSLDFLEGMCDERLGGLPWGQVLPFVVAPFAEHTRRDDAELAAAWYEGVSCAREMLGFPERGAKAEKALREIVLDPACWEKSSGLRFPKKRDWTGESDYCALSEAGPVLSALDRMIALDPADREARARADGLVAGLRRLVVAHDRRLTPAGAFPVDAPVYTFPTDVAVRGRGLAPELSTGFADATMRLSTLIHPVMVHPSPTRSPASRTSSAARRSSRARSTRRSSPRPASRASAASSRRTATSPAPSRSTTTSAAIPPPSGGCRSSCSGSSRPTSGATRPAPPT